MNSQTLYLDKIYDYVSSSKEIPHRRNDSKVYMPYKNIVLELTKDIPTDPGWFAWRDNDSVLYVGKALESLYKIIRDDLFKTYIPFWAEVDDDVVNRMTEKYGGKHDSNHKRAYLRKGTTSIVWVSTVNADKEFLNNVLLNLIFELRPYANLKKGKSYLGVETLSEYKSIIERFKKRASPSESTNVKRHILKERSLEQPPEPVIAEKPIDSSTDIMTPTELYKKVINSVVAIETGNGSGSGILISPNGIIVTNKHVAKKETKVIGAIK